MVRSTSERSRLKDALDRILEKGVIIDAIAQVHIVSDNLLRIKNHMTLCYLETAAKIGLDFPKGTNFDASGWQDLMTKQQCPVCGMKSQPDDLNEHGCPWCGWNYKSDER